MLHTSLTPCISPLVHLLLRVCGRNSVNFFVLLFSFSISLFFLFLFFCFGLWGHPLQKAAAIALYAFISATRASESEIDSNSDSDSNSDLGSSCSRPTSPSRSTLLPFVLPPVSSFNFNFYLLFLFIFNSFSVAATATATTTATLASPTPEHPEFSILFNSLKRARVEAFFYNSISRELPMRPWSQRTVGRCWVKNLQKIN